MRKAEETMVPIVNVLFALKKDIETEVEDIEVKEVLEADMSIMIRV
jgi:hypothetical protein